ncbi:hypothetical protein CO613_11060 [Lysobacteraceae bacterium NML07-0707]|nr:hypothetical protein CO613_11060 [Xanthomonadaceae bacterium NML07-0707]
MPCGRWISWRTQSTVAVASVPSRYWTRAYVREALDIEIDTRLPAERVIRALEQLKEWRGMPSKHARHNAKLWHIARACSPFKSQRLLSDNDSEFKAEFTQIVLDDGAVRWLTYPKCPRMNAHAERFNRTLQEAFIEFHKDLLFQDIKAFNDKLLDNLIWFNESRLYYALGLRSPMQLLEDEHQCNVLAGTVYSSCDLPH